VLRHEIDVFVSGRDVILLRRRGRRALRQRRQISARAQPVIGIQYFEGELNAGRYGAAMRWRANGDSVGDVQSAQALSLTLPAFDHPCSSASRDTWCRRGLATGRDAARRSMRSSRPIGKIRSARSQLEFGSLARAHSSSGLIVVTGRAPALAKEHAQSRTRRRPLPGQLDSRADPFLVRAGGRRASPTGFVSRRLHPSRRALWW